MKVNEINHALRLPDANTNSQTHEGQNFVPTVKHSLEEDGNPDARDDTSDDREPPVTNTTTADLRPVASMEELLARIENAQRLDIWL